MNRIIIPPSAQELMTFLRENGEKAYVVGGCTRDSLLGREPNDWDIATSASPEKMLRIFSGFRTIETGLKHGTITVLCGGVPYEITTFRIDGTYSDNRHPDSVTFVKDVRLDLARRDFTVNSMAYNEEEGLIDPFGGEADLKRGVFRCVGDPDERFREDGLRILRALRFSSTYGFRVEEKTAEAAVRNANLLKGIAAERVYSELCKLLKGKGRENVLLSFPEIVTEVLPELFCCVGFDQNNPYHRYNVYDHIVHSVGAYQGNDLAVLWALLLHDAGKPDVYTADEKGGHFYGHAKISYDKAMSAFERLKSDKATQTDACELILHHDTVFQPTEKCLKRWLNRIGPEQLKRLLDVHEADIHAQSETHLQERVSECALLREMLEKILSENACFSLKDLAVNGNLLLQEGFQPGRGMGEILHYLLDQVISGNLPNEREVLLEEAKNTLKKDS